MLAAPVNAGASRDVPVILLSYAYSGAQQVQDLVASGTALACTSRTGIVPLCATATETWRRVEGSNGAGLSQLAAATIRRLVIAQVTMVLAATGKTRWCELAIGDPGAAQRFLQVFPQTVFVTVHRNCLDVICAGLAANPWGLHNLGLGPYLMPYPGNNVAALATYWADSTDELLAFEGANSQISHRIRFEDATFGSGEPLAALRAWLGLDGARDAFPELPDAAGPQGQPVPPPGSEVPMEMLPPQLRQRISRLHAELGYAPLPGAEP